MSLSLPSAVSVILTRLHVYKQFYGAVGNLVRLLYLLTASE